MDKLDQIIWLTVSQIPVGKVMTYGQIAKACGYPGYARYVGTVLKKLPSDTDIPWHRVINAQGRISFPFDSEAYQKQLGRLMAEGVNVENGRIKLRHYQY